MSRLFSQIAAASLLAAYGALAILGHGGMHAVQDATGAEHSHAGHRAGCAHHHEGADDHHRCCHGHSHSHDHTADAHDQERDDGPHPHGPHHDPNDCVVCHYFATAAVQHAGAPEIAGELLASESTPSHLLEIAGTDRFVQPIRGPPGMTS